MKKKYSGEKEKNSMQKVKLCETFVGGKLVLGNRERKISILEEGAWNPDWSCVLMNTNALDFPGENECDTRLDCPRHSPCMSRSSLQGGWDDFPFTISGMPKTCYLGAASSSIEDPIEEIRPLGEGKDFEPRTGGGKNYNYTGIVEGIVTLDTNPTHRLPY